ncbi:hydrogenase iron-sulfur subunit, partial [Candidatus Bathyarchaeota archaeon]|nr:hydrogenase iron-sulfur subunit [Candidatus Bathyarchaeota archaeon]
DSNRLRLEWVSASEGKKFAGIVDEFIDDIKNAGPLMKHSSRNQDLVQVKQGMSKKA